MLEAQEKRAEAAVALSTAELERQQTLRQGHRAQAQLDIAQANSNRDKAALEEVRRQITVARMASREEDIAAARQSLAAAIARRDARETKLARRKLAAPVGGTVQQVYYRPGEMVPAGAAGAVRSCRPATSSCASSSRRRCCRRSRSATRSR